jgi:hypothetical protein
MRFAAMLLYAPYCSDQLLTKLFNSICSGIAICVGLTIKCLLALMPTCTPTVLDDLEQPALRQPTTSGNRYRSPKFLTKLPPIKQQ